MDLPCYRLQDMERISSTLLRPRLTSILKKVESGSPVAVTKLNLPKVVMVDVSFYERAVEALAMTPAKEVPGPCGGFDALSKVAT